MLVCREAGREKPFFADGIFSDHLPVERVDLAPRTGHGVHYAVAGVPAIVVGHPCMDIPRFRRDFPVVPVVVPREDAAQGVFALAVLDLRVVGIVGRQQGQLPVGIDIPSVQSEAVAAPGVVVDLLQYVDIVESAALVALGGIIRPDDVHVVVVDVYFLVPVAVLVVVGRRLVDGACRYLPVPVAPRQAQEFVEGPVHADPLDVLQPESVRCGRRGREFHQSAQSAARLVHRRGAVQQRSVVDEIGRDHREVGHAQHRVVDAHAVPRHLRMRGARAAERHGRKRCAAVLLDEDRRVERQHVGDRQGDVFFQDDRVEFRLLHADTFHRPPAPDRDFADGYDALFAPRCRSGLLGGLV